MSSLRNPNEKLEVKLINKPSTKSFLLEDEEDPPKEVDLNTKETMTASPPKKNKEFTKAETKTKFEKDKNVFIKMAKNFPQPDDKEKKVLFSRCCKKVNKKRNITNIDKDKNKQEVGFETREEGIIKTFPLYNDDVIFHGINKSYMQDAYENTGGDSDDEKIKYGEKYLFEELEDSVNCLLEAFNTDNNFTNYMSRTFKFKEDEEEN